MQSRKSPRKTCSKHDPRVTFQGGGGGLPFSLTVSDTACPYMGWVASHSRRWEASTLALAVRHAGGGVEGACRERRRAPPELPAAVAAAAAAAAVAAGTSKPSAE